MVHVGAGTAGILGTGCKVPEDHWRLREGSWMYSRAVRAGETFSIQGESQVCVEELTWRQVEGEACRLAPAGSVGVQRRNLPRRPSHQASRYLQMVDNRADRIKPLSADLAARDSHRNSQQGSWMGWAREADRQQDSPFQTWAEKGSRWEGRLSRLGPGGRELLLLGTQED